MRSSSILVKFVTLASVIGIVAATGDVDVKVVECSKCDSCCKSGVQCISGSAMGYGGYTCLPLSFTTQMPTTLKLPGGATTTTSSPRTTCTSGAGGPCRPTETGKSPSVPIPTTRGNNTIVTTGPTRNTTIVVPTSISRPGNSTSRPGNQTSTTATRSSGGSGGGAGTGTGSTPTGGSGSGSGSGSGGGAGGAGTTIVPAATTSRPAGSTSTGAADRNGGSVLAVVVLGSLVWFLG